VQLDCSIENKICIVDSDSSDFSQYERVKMAFPDVEIHYAKNKNYEYGAWKYALSQYPDYDIYFCIQDSLYVRSKINLHFVNDTTALIHYHVSGYNSHLSIKNKGIANLQNSGLQWGPIIDRNFVLAQHSSFVVSRNILIDIFNTLTIPPTDKDGSCFYERNFGLYFILKNITTVDIQDKIWKIHGWRI
jgi:hypothetical protein